MTLFAIVKSEWGGDKRTGRCLYYCVYPDGTRKLCMDDRIAKEHADAYNVPIAAEIAEKAGGYSA